MRGEYSAADHNALLVTGWSDLRWSCLDGNEDDVKPPLERPMWGCLYYREEPHKARHPPPIYSTMPGELCCKPALMAASSSFPA